MTQSKLSRHQKVILLILLEEIKDEFWGFPITMLSRMAARRLETEPGSYVENKLEWRKRRRSEEVSRFHKGEIDVGDLEMMLYFLRDGPGRLAETLTEKWRATFSRSLKRLETRGLITRISWIRTERREGKSYHVQYVGGRTYRVVLTPEGKALAGMIAEISFTELARVEQKTG